MQETRKKKNPHIFITEKHSRLKDSLEWKEMLSSKWSISPKCHAGNSPLCWRWHMAVKGQAVSCNAEGEYPARDSLLIGLSKRLILWSVLFLGCFKDKSTTCRVAL